MNRDKPNLKLVCFLSTIQLVCAVLNPVVLIPGDGGAQLEARLNKSQVVHYICEKTTNEYFNIWLNLELLVPVVIDCWIDNIKLSYDNVTRTTRNSAGVDIRVPGFGASEPVEWLDPSKASTGSYFNIVGDLLVSLGLKRGTTLLGAPYDFRKAPNENQGFFVQLKALVEATYTKNNGTPVVLLAHSMGGPMSLYFLNHQAQSWKDKYIKSLVALSGAWGGSVKALKVYAMGDDLGSLVLRPSIMRQEQITSPSLAWLIPSTLFWKPDELLVQTDKKNFTLANLKEFFEALSFMDGWEMYQDTKGILEDFKAPGVEVHCLYGTGINTVERLFYKPGTWLDGTPVLISGDGDGTVNRRSLEGCMHWRSLQKQKIYAVQMPKIDHMQILRDPAVLKYLTQLFKH